MRASYEWLRDLAGLPDLPPEEAAHVLTMAGFCVEHITLIDYSSLIVGRIVSQQPHPSSRKPLWIHQVDLGTETRQIIAGASNAVPGAFVPVALPGATVPRGGEVRDGKIAGHETRGMLCGEDELLLADESEGIMLLEKAAPGQRFDEIVPSDAIFDVDVTPNRPDCLSHLGLARELAAALGRSLGRDFMPGFTGGVEPSGADLIDVGIETPERCARYIGAVVSGVKVGESPLWMRRRLRQAGIRPINNVVDITNYVQVEYGQPLHAFDLAALKGRQIRVRLARPGETLRCLDGETRELTPQTLVIADAESPVAIAGVIGGQDSAVTERTADVLLEAASFEGRGIRATSRSLRLRTESSNRFEKGLSPELAQAGARRAAMLLAEVADGRVHIGWADQYPRPQEPARVSLRPQRIEDLLGMSVPEEEAEAILRRLEFQVRPQPDGSWDVLPPVYRLDVTIPEDVVEEVGRIHGYGKIPPTLPGRRRAQWRPVRPSQDRMLDPIRQELCAAGHTETLGPALVSHRLIEDLGLEGRAMRLINPVSDDQDALRTSLIVTMLRSAAGNSHLRPQAAIFELGRVYLRRSDDPEGQPEELTRLGMLRLAGSTPEAGRDAFLLVKGAFEKAARTVRDHVVRHVPTVDPLFHPGRCAQVLVDGVACGVLGELHPRILDKFELPGRAVVLEVDALPLLEGGTERRVRAVPRFPAIDRDLAVVVAGSVPAERLSQTIDQAGGELLEGARAFDEYRGDQVGEGRKSVAFSLTFRAPERTLTDREVDERLTAVRSALTAEHQATFRT